MAPNKTKIVNVKTNLITGFLGVGKTTAIIHLLQQRPATEKWSVLVNEFGEMGIDGHLMKNDDAAIVIKQVPGGCICCAAGLPLQVAVNQLLKQTHPDRLIIEPSGMGHPRKILKALTDQNYQGVLDMRACLCLLDPRKLNDKRYLESELFVDQIDVADIVIANKTDLAEPQDKITFEQYISKRSSKKITKWVENGQIDIHWLDLSYTDARSNNTAIFSKTGTSVLEDSFNKITLNFSPDVQFNLTKVKQYLLSLQAERIKGILNTDEAYFVFNLADGCLQTQYTTNTEINRLEIISLEKFIQNEVNTALMGCASEQKS